MSEYRSLHTARYPSVSVVMATYNGEKFLARQLHSIISQTIPPKEIIVCDDGSTDNTIEILETFSQDTPIDFRYYRNETKLGVAANFKKAVALTSPGNYIALSDQDDIWLPEKIERSIELLANIDDNITPSMIYSDLIMIDSAENILNTSVNNELGHDKYIHCLPTLLFGNVVLGCTIMMNEKMKDLFQDIPDNTPLNHDAWISLIGFSFGKIACLPEPLIKYRKHGANISFKEKRKKTKTGRIWNHFLSLFIKNNFLNDQLVLAKSFYNTYKERLSENQRILFKDFSALEHASYLKKKIAFEKAFKNKWIKR